MLIAKVEQLPDLWTTALDEIFAVGVVVDHKLYDPILPIAATVAFDEAIDRSLKLKASRSRASLVQQMKEQVAMLHDAARVLARPCRGEHDAFPM